jgi:glutathione peroxidase
MFKFLFMLVAVVGVSALLYACFNGNQMAARPKKDANAPMSTVSFYTLKCTGLEGQPVDLSQYKGKKVLLLNVASKCGYTPQYADWQKFYDANKEDIVVVGIPSNDFMAQEPGSAGEIAEFCQKNYGVTFPMLEKQVVKGEGKSPLYTWLTNKAQNGWNEQEPSWNFCKYLINEKGELTHFFASNIKPESQEFLVALGL